MSKPPLPATVAGLLLAVGCAVAAAIVVYRFSTATKTARRPMLAVAAGGLAFQVVHVLEHGLQLGFWFAKPRGGAWLSSWASGTADGLFYFCSLVPSGDAPVSLGVEMLHLTGNVIFLGGLTAWQISMRSQNRSIKSLDLAEAVQMFHVFEHVLLVGTLLLFGKATGFSTMFGFVEGSTLVASRVWFHFGINTIATGLALRAAHQTWGGSTPREAVADEVVLVA